MNSDTKPEPVWWARVPHGIVDAAIADTLKLLLWYCYDKSEDWTFSVPEVARSLDKTRQCIRKYFREFTDDGVLTKTRELETKHGLTPLYTFHRDRVDAFIKRRLKVNLETDPETDRETSPETDVETGPETDPATGVSGTKNNIPRPSTENDSTEKESTKTNGNNGIDGAPSLQSPSGQSRGNLADEFEQFFQPAGSTIPGVASIPTMSSSGAPAAEGGVGVGVASRPSASTDPTKDKPNDVPGGTSAAAIQVSANGNTNAAARSGNGEQPWTSAERAASTVAKSRQVRAPMPREAEQCAESLIRAWKKAAFTPESLKRMETEFRKRLAENDWSSCSSSYLAMSDVKRLKEQVQKEFGDYQ